MFTVFKSAWNACTGFFEREEREAIRARLGPEFQDFDDLASNNPLANDGSFHGAGSRMTSRRNHSA